MPSILLLLTPRSRDTHDVSEPKIEEPPATQQIPKQIDESQVLRKFNEMFKR